VDIQTGDTIEIQHYNELALEVNRLYSDNTVGLDWTTSDIILDDVADPAGEPILAKRTLSPIPLFDDYLVVTIDDVTLTESIDYSVNFTTGEITFVYALSPDAVLKVYNKTTHRYGWGQTASIYPITVGDEIVRADETVSQAYLEANTNNLLDKVNIMEIRTGGPTELTRYNKGQIISASDKMIIQSTIADDIVVDDNYWKNEIATVSSDFESFTRSSDWDDQLVGEYRFTWDSYAAMRYFFNSGCNLRLYLEMSGDVSNQGYYNWNQVITDMGTLIIDYTTTSQTGTGGTSESLGMYDLTSTYQKIFTSGSPSNPVSENGPNPGEYGDFDEYGDWSALTLVWHARISDDTPSNGEISLDVRVVLDDMDMNLTTVGTTSKYGGYKLADDVVDNSATFSMADYVPVISELNNFENDDDS